MTLRLRGAFSPNSRVAPLVDGSVDIPGIEIDWDTGDAGHLHERHLRDSAHDVFEFSISNFLITLERPNPLWDWVMLPVFASKATLGLKTWVNVDSGIESGADLKGKKFGIPDFTMTAGLWFRAQLRALWGWQAHDLEWFVAREGQQSHARQMGVHLQPPDGVRLHWSSAMEVDRMLQAGEIDAAFPAADCPIDTTSDRVRRLFPDRGRQFMADFRQAAGFLPVNHAVFVQRRLLEKEPWVAEALFDGFDAARQESYRRDRANAGIFLDGNADVAWQAEHFGADPFPYGLAANRSMLAMAAEQSAIDGLTARQLDLAELVPESLQAS